jgi:GNAT superfamily N-acetyltransferase
MGVPSDELRAFAEDPRAFVALGPDEERIATDRFTVTFSPGAHFWSTSVQRLRLSGDVDGAVAGVRGLMAERGRTSAVWQVGPSATPAHLSERLRPLGMEPEYRDGSTILILTEPRATTPSPFEVKRAASYAEHRAAIEVSVEGFVFEDADADDERRRARDTFRSERTGGHTLRLLALDGHRPVATLQAWRAPVGLYIGGATTIPSERGRGAMSALLVTAWNEAIRAGTPALVAFGGHMSTRLMERLGFTAHGHTQHLIDRPRAG